MDLASTTLIAIGLAMDCFAVSITTGLSVKRNRIKKAAALALSFGFFQGLMPVLGWMAGLTMKDFIMGFDHWIAFGLLAFIGVKMIFESFSLKEEKDEKSAFNGYMVLLLSIATSIDALAVGLSFAFLQVSIVAPVVIIAAVAALLSFTGFFVGQKIGHFFENRIEVIGGLILIGIGIKILLEHLWG
jgi:manganese efflux pump family protein